MPRLGQTNQLPDASTKVNFTLTPRDSNITHTLVFDNGIGFHEQLWSDVPYREAAPSWRRGNARLHVVGDPAANHSVVWWEGTKRDGTTWTTAYASMDGKGVKEGCDRDKKGLLHIEATDTTTNVTMTVADGLNLKLDITKFQPFTYRRGGLDQISYGRWTGMVDAALGNATKLTGVAWIEEGDFFGQPWMRGGDGEVLSEGVVVEEGY